MTSPFDLTGKVAVVTGSSKGIGRAIVECLAGMGAKVVVSSRKQEPCEAVAAGIRQKGGEAVVITCNVSRREEVEALIAGTNKQFGGIDIVVCNAAVNPVFGPLATLTDEAFDKIMSANVKAAIWFANLACPVMAARGLRPVRPRGHRSARGNGRRRWSRILELRRRLRRHLWRHLQSG